MTITSAAPASRSRSALARVRVVAIEQAFPGVLEVLEATRGRE
ncbi:hypothetical protein ACQP1W_04680 [Spirillospora sp. CA-255316]